MKRTAEQVRNRIEILSERTTKNYNIIKKAQRKLRALEALEASVAESSTSN